MTTDNHKKIKKKITGIDAVRHMMLKVIISLIPVSVIGIYHFGLHAALIIFTSMVTCALTEFIFDFIRGKNNTALDLSAVVTGLLLGLCLPPSVPLYIPFLGSIFAIIVVKELFGGFGKNILNPALTARLFLLICFKTSMSNFEIDGVSSATPLMTLSSGQTVNALSISLGSEYGVIGNATFALLVGGMLLWVLGVIKLEIPITVLVSFALVLGLFGGQGFSPSFILSHLMSGGIMMAAFFMATDPVTHPVTFKENMIYGILLGIIAGLFRIYGSSMDYTVYSVLIMNLLTPFLKKLHHLKSSTNK